MTIFVQSFYYLQENRTKWKHTGLGESTGLGQSWKQFCSSPSHLLFHSRASKTWSSFSFSTWCFPSIVEKGKFWPRRTLQTPSTVLDEINNSNTWVKGFRKLKSRTKTSLCQTHEFLSLQEGRVYAASRCDFLLEIQNGFGTSITAQIKGGCVHQTLLSALSARNPSETGKELFQPLPKI